VVAKGYVPEADEKIDCKMQNDPEKLFVGSSSAEPVQS